MEQLDRVKEILDEVASYGRSFHERTDEGAYHRMSLTLAALEDDLREVVQAATRDEMTAVIGKLESDAELTPDELRLIRLWMVSDAEFYVQMENDYRDWLAELNRLVGVVDMLRSQRLTPEIAGRLSGTIRDAIRVIGDITYFKEQERRIGDFERATARLYSEDKRTLARILRQKQRSASM
ncbi:MAG TPA: hypothetical protein VFZ01_08695 [Geminicoccaceae bacterium]